MRDLRDRAQESIAYEFAGAELGDVRRTRRLQRIAEVAMRAPNVGFPRMVEDDSELEGIYRFFAGGHVAPEDVLEPHISKTLARMRQVSGPVLVAHDTTDLKFGGLHERAGLGLTNGKQRGFFLHLALAIVPGEERLALGTCGLERLCRAEYKGAARKHSREISNDPNRESLRWLRLVEQVEGRRGEIECIHLIDREGDKFDLLALLKQRRARFIVRGHYDRNSSDGGRLMARLAKLKPQAYRDIEICERMDDGRRTTTKQKHPPRKSRAARVAVAGCEVTIRTTETAHAAETELELNVVKIWEPKPPPGEPAVCWMLYTSEPVKTAEELLTIVDHYRSRWVIEEFFSKRSRGDLRFDSRHANQTS